MLILRYEFPREDGARIRRMAGSVSPALQQRFTRAVMELEKQLKIAANKMRRTVSAGYSKRKTGLLAQSVTHRIYQQDKRTLVGLVGSNTPYARMREMGGTLKASRAGALTIPLPGKNYGDVRSLVSQGKVFFARDMVFYRGAPGELRGHPPIPIYVLRKSVPQPAQHWITDGAMAATPNIQSILGEGVQFDIGKGGA